jgi:hypothetical protein
MYHSNVPVVIKDGSWILASDNVIAGTIMPFCGIDDFTSNADPRLFYNLEFPGPIRSAFPEEEQAG